MERLRKSVHPGKVFLEDVLVPLGITVTDAARILNHYAYFQKSQFKKGIHGAYRQHSAFIAGICNNLI